MLTGHLITILSDQMLAAVNVTLVQAGLLLKARTAVDATLIPAPSSTKKHDGARDAEMTSSKKGSNCYFGMKAHIGVDMESGLVFTPSTPPQAQRTTRRKRTELAALF